EGPAARRDGGGAGRGARGGRRPDARRVDGGGDRRGLRGDPQAGLRPIGLSSSAYEIEWRWSSPVGVVSYAPIRRRGGEYALIVTDGASPTCRTRWMSDGAKSKASPGRTTRVSGSGPRASRSSRIAPCATATPPAERSWSWKPVSWSSIH